MDATFLADLQVCTPVCQLCIACDGAALHYNDPGKKRSNPGPDSASVDCVIPDEGYTPENTRIICRACNTLKNANTPTSILKLAAYFGLQIPSTH